MLGQRSNHVQISDAVNKIWKSIKENLKKIFIGIFVTVVGGLILIFIVQSYVFPPECTDRSELLGHDTIPDRTAMKTDEEFDKRWILGNPEDENNCTWTTEYKAVFVEGNGSINLAGQSSFYIPEEEVAGEYVKLCQGR